jgi:erythromycin esterase
MDGETAIELVLDNSSGARVVGSLKGSARALRNGFVTVWRLSNDQGDVFAVPADHGGFEVRLPTGGNGFVAEYTWSERIALPVQIGHSGGKADLYVHAASRPGTEVIESVKRSSVPLSALPNSEATVSLEDTLKRRPLVIALGESTHGTKEFFDAKASLIRWLVERDASRTVALEADVIVCRELNAYIHGKGAMPLSDLLEYFSSNIATVEFSEFVKQLRAYNASSAGDAQVSVVGLDELQPVFARGDIREIFDAAGVDLWKEDLAALQPLVDATVYADRALSEKDAAASDDVIERMQADAVARTDALTRALGPDRFTLLMDDLRYLRNSVRILRARADGAGGSGSVRDAAMSARLLSHVEASGPVIAWAHNSHVSRSDGGLGTLLAKELGDRYVAVGMSFAAGSFQAFDQDANYGMRKFVVPPLDWGDVLEPFVRGRLAPSVINLRSLDKRSRAWFNVPRLTREFGISTHEGEPSVLPVRVTDRFDWLVAVPEAHRAVPFGRKLADLP